MNKNILWVANTTIALDTINLDLTNAGYLISNASSAQAAQAHLEANQPAVMIVDYDEVKSDAADMIKQTLRQLPALRIIVLAVENHLSEVFPLMEQGAFDFLRKPIQPNRLLHALRRACGSVETQEELQKVKDKMIRVDQLAAMGVLAAGVAHEIFQPLQAISNYNMLLNQRREELGIEDEDLTESYDSIKAALEREKDLVKSIKAFAHAEDEETIYSGISMNQAVNNSLRLLGAQLKNLEIDLDLNLADALPPVRGNLRQLEQISINLILQAVNAIESKGHIRIDSFCQDDRVGLRWQHDGETIPADKLAACFAPISEEEDDYGIRICMGIVQEHQGEFKMSSSDAQTETIIFLPALAD